MSERPKSPAAPEGYSTVNPFIIADDAGGLIEFLREVFGATLDTALPSIADPRLSEVAR